MDAAQYINQSSGEVEIYTPENIIRGANWVMGGIDLDPSSSDTANQRVGAKHFFTREDDGLHQPWFGRVWMNHPFGRDTNGPWINKLVKEYRSGAVKQAICICFASTSEKWFRPLLDYPQCFLSPRTNYMLPDGRIYRGVTKGSVLTYFGDNITRFARGFNSIGVTKIAIQ